MPQVPSESAQGPSPETHFAPAERATPEAVQQAAAAVGASAVMTATLQSVGGILLILNPQRQIVAVNGHLLRFLGCEEPEKLLGMRPGEALHCVHAKDSPGGGCGAGPFCHTCGAAVAIVSSQRDNAPTEAECLLTATVDGQEQAFEFRVRATPVVMAGQRLTVISLRDISDLKRREALEAVFLHDLMNTASALLYAVRGLDRCPEAERAEVLRDIADLTRRLVAEIAERRDLRDMEAGRFRARTAYTSPSEVREVLAHVFAHHACASGKRLVCQFPAEGDDALLRTDSVLLIRALTNLVKNALEATGAGGEVRLSCRFEGHVGVFEVWNAGAMPDEVARHIFVRYYSTKGRQGRGLGTYGARLIVERYLGGRLSFTTSEAEGTTFRLELPREAEEPAAAE
ncbi:MAG TPA: sensor histidine kinase [Planctomycetota bacterium]|nr:sensor histidine kinase [Planctomycetota bacterium]